MAEENKPDPAAELAALKAENEKIKADLAKLQAAPPKKEDADLTDKTEEARKAAAQKANDTKAIEAALRFSLGSEKFLKDNQSLLPKDISDIFKTANSETYSSEIQKDSALKSAIIQSFFKVQSNLDLLKNMPSLKNQLEEYLKMSKDGKQEKAQEIFNNIFEPSLEIARSMKKAEALNKGYNPGEDSVDGIMKKKMEDLSNKHFLGVNK